MRIVGYVYDSDLWCVDCLLDAGINQHSDSVDAIFDWHECDYPRHCHACNGFLGGELTIDGLEALKQNYRDGSYRLPDGSPTPQFEEYMEHFDYGGGLHHFIWTFVGFMDPYGDVLD